MIRKPLFLVSSSLRVGAMVGLGVLLHANGAAHAEEIAAHAGNASQPSEEAAQSSVDSSDIVVTATKQANVRAQAVPLAISAFGSAALAERNVRTFDDLSNVVPNTQMTDATATKANVSFSIRGLGTNNAAASVEPQVGLFIDGVYVGTQLGAFVDTFDLEAVEILRGPQGVLFGKNVTGGAVVLRTTAPKDALYVDARASVESRTTYTGSAVLSGPLAENLSVKVAGYYSKDDGYLRDISTGKGDGGGRTWIGRGALRYHPGDFDTILRYERGSFKTDQGSGLQNTPLFDNGTLGKFEVASSDVSFGRLKWQNATWESNLHVGFGDGIITNVFGWRTVKYDALSDLDGTVADLFTNNTRFKQHQFSNEIRYAGKFGNLDISGGLYYFKQDYRYAEQRRALGSPTSVGGIAHNNALGAFLAADWHATDTFTINLGGRYTRERKKIRSAAVKVNGCDLNTVFSGQLVCNFDFAGAKTFPAFIPKVGFQWKPEPRMQVYGSWTIGLRSGGFAVRRNTVAGGGPYDDEKNYALEAGIKTDLADGRVRLNAAAYRMAVHNLQRDILQPDPVLGQLSKTANVANAVFQGVEIETVVKLVRGLTLDGSLGITDGRYTKVTADISGDGLVNSVDLNLPIVRVVPWSYSIGATYEHDIGEGVATARLSFGHKDKQLFSDNGTFYMSPQNRLDGTLKYEIGNFSASIYGKNLLNKRFIVEGAILPAAFGGGHRRIDKGRVIGASLGFQL